LLEVVVNTWLKRYKEQGLSGLVIRKGRGRRSILQKDTDLAAVRRAVQNNRQRVSLAKAELEQELGKEFGVLTLKRFLKKTVAATNECAG
jgi:transposase